MKKLLLGAGVMTGALVLASALVAGAQTTPAVTSDSTNMAAAEQQVLQVGPKGNVLMRGTVASVASGVITVNSWGGVWTVNVPTSAQILPATVNNDLTQFKTGDFVGVQGAVTTGASWTINATLVRDWTVRVANGQERKQNVQAIVTVKNGGTAQNYAGVASNLSGSSFTLTVNGTADTVNVASGAEVVNKNYLTLPLASIQSGDNVRVWGVNASGTITATIVRDTSIPAAQGNSNGQ